MHLEYFISIDDYFSVDGSVTFSSVHQVCLGGTHENKTLSDFKVVAPVLPKITLGAIRGPGAFGESLKSKTSAVVTTFSARAAVPWWLHVAQ